VKFVLARTRESKLEDEIVLSFFFNTRGDEGKGTTLGMYRSLLFQLHSVAPDLRNVQDKIDISRGS
jgi:hypothetical protein